MTSGYITGGWAFVWTAYGWTALVLDLIHAEGWDR